MQTTPEIEGNPLDTSPSRSGTQSLERAVNVLRAIASRGRNGMRLKEVAQTSGLTVSTCHRMLQYLHKEGLLEKNERANKYQLGPLLYELGLLARPRYSLSEICDQAMQNIAEKTQDTVYLSERSGLEAVCTMRKLGDYPVKAMPLDVGIRRPLGVGAGGLAILGGLEAEEAEAIIHSIGNRIEHYGQLNLPLLREAVQTTRGRGYSFMSGTTAGTAAVGVAFPKDNPIGAISVAAISGRMEPRRQAEVAALIHAEMAQVEQTLGQVRGIPVRG